MKIPSTVIKAALPHGIRVVRHASGLYEIGPVGDVLIRQSRTGAIAAIKRLVRSKAA